MTVTSRWIARALLLLLLLAPAGARSEELPFQILDGVLRAEHLPGQRQVHHKEIYGHQQDAPLRGRQPQDIIEGIVETIPVPVESN